MEKRDYSTFDRWERKAFDKAYPPEEIKEFIGENGEQQIEIFSALKTFDFPDTKPDAKNIVLAHFSDSRFAPQILMQEDANGETLIYRKNIVPLLRASQDVFWRIFDLFTDEVKMGINNVFSRTTPPSVNAERDWQK